MTVRLPFDVVPVVAIVMKTVTTIQMAMCLVVMPVMEDAIVMAIVMLMSMTTC